MNTANIYRDKTLNNVSESDVGQKLRVAGWVENIRDHGGVSFVDLRDMYGVLQVVMRDTSLLDGISKEDCITIEGVVDHRDEETYNPKIPTGTIELEAHSVEILGRVYKQLPFEIMTSKETREDVRLKYRYLDLRNAKVRDNMIFRSNVISFLRQKMVDMGFLEIQTPILCASSPEGARDYIVPSRKFKGKFYALPQAPQIFKEILMVSGFDKYYQIAPCFRDEDCRSDRTLEFYQLDFEMAFVEEEDVYKIGEKIFYDTFTHFSNKKVSKAPFKRIAYKDAMLKYGTDKPDLRNPLLIIDLSDIFENSDFKPFRGSVVRGITVDGIGDKSNSWFNDMVAYAKTIGMPGIGYITVNNDLSFKGPIDKFLTDDDRKKLIERANLKENSVLFFIADRKEKVAAKQAGMIRNELGRRLDLIDEDRYEFCIINDFPMFEYNEEEKKYDFCHNAFSMPKNGIEAFDNEKIDDIIASQFDFVCNGNEMASGAVRNHSVEALERAFEMVGYDKSIVKDKFTSLYNAFKYGAPPHAGMAPGIDRMVMLLTGESNLREVQAFPMSVSGADMMMNCPSEVTELQLREAHIKLR